MIKKYIIASLCVVAYFHLLPWILEKGPMNSTWWWFLGLILGVPYIPSGFITTCVFPGGLHSADEPTFQTIQILISDLLYVSIIWIVYYFRNRKAAKIKK